MITRSERQKKEVSARHRQRLSGFSVMGDILLIVILMIAVASLFLLIRGRLEGSVPHLAGYHFYAVSGESMQRAYGAGSLVVVEPAAPEQFAPDDLIIVHPHGDVDRVCTCRIVDIDPGYGFFLTDCGEAGINGEPVKTAVANVRGRVVRSIPYAGYIFDFAQKPAGIVLLIIVPALAIIVFQLRKLGRYNRVDSNTPGSSTRFNVM